MTDEEPDGERAGLREECTGIIFETFDTVSEVDVRQELVVCVCVCVCVCEREREREREREKRETDNVVTQLQKLLIKETNR